MNKTVLRFAFVSLVTFAAAPGARAMEQNPLVIAVTLPATGCSSQVEIERGWEYQQELLDARLAARPETLGIPGTIISQPFRSFPVYRTDLPSAATSSAKARKGVAQNRPRTEEHRF